MSSKCDLRIDWCSYEAAKYAIENWHYSKRMPAGKMTRIGAWECGKFIGAIIFSRGATPMIGRPYGLQQTEICELTRVALRRHTSQVSRILSIAIRFFKKNSPGTRLIVSFADMDHGHHGGIYQANNWIYTGISTRRSRMAFIIRGKKVHPRSVGALKGAVQSIGWIRKNIDPSAQEFFGTGKHRYLMPLDDDIKATVLPLSEPYPKRAKQAMAVPTAQRRGSADLHAPTAEKTT